MDCRNFHRNLEDYLEGGLDFPGRFGMERHAQQCYVCGRSMADAQRLGEVAQELTRVSAPPDLETAVLARIHARGSYSWWQDLWIYGLAFPTWRRLALGASGLALVGFASLAALRYFQAIPGEGPPIAGETEQAPVPIAGEQRVPAAPSVSESSDAPAENRVTEQMQSPARVSFRRPRARYLTEEEASSARRHESADADYLEFPVPGPDNSEFIMRLPKTIRLRYGQASQEHFVRNVSH